MRIRTQFMISTAIFGIFLTIVAGSLILTDQQIDQIENQLDISGHILKRTDDLNTISSQYMLYQETEQLALWKATFNSIADSLSKLQTTNAEQNTLINRIRSDLLRVNQSFFNMAIILEKLPRDENVRVIPEFQTEWNKLVTEHQVLGLDGSLFSDWLRNQDSQLELMNLGLILSLLGIFGVFLVTNYVLFYRRTLKSISKLQAGTRIVGSGNLAYSLEADKVDEIGDLSQSFNKMTANLRNVTASKTDLEKEIFERKKTEEALRKAEEETRRRNEELERLHAELEEKALQVEEYANHMEELAKERAEQLKNNERLAAIGATAGMVGHDIRNPLQSITNDVFLAKSELSSFPDGEQKDNIEENLGEIDKAVRYVDKIVADLQDYARPLMPAFEEVDLKVAVDQLLGKSRIPRNIRVKVDIAKNAEVLVVDPALLNRILSNLVINAVQAMPEGGVLAVYSYRDMASTVIRIQDTGDGIPADIKSKLFTPLFTTKSKGQGFGLAVVKRLTEALGGTVTFESQVGKGTTFIVRLPTQKT